MSHIPGLRRFFRHDRADVGQEMQFHIESRADDLARLGLDRDQAYRQALAEFGDVRRYHDETTRIDRERVRELRMKDSSAHIGRRRDRLGRRGAVGVADPGASGNDCRSGGSAARRLTQPLTL